MNFEINPNFAKELDTSDPFKSFKNEFIFPESLHGNEVIYLCGNSLGLQPKTAKKALENELEDWAKWGVEGHFQGRKPWFHYHKFLTDLSAEIAGAKSHEVVVMNQLTVNLHLLLHSFYRPTFTQNENGKTIPKRYKLLMEAGAFPSDMYAVQTHVESRGLSYDDAVVELSPRVGEHTLRTEDILQAIEQLGDSLALCFFSGVQYYTGQFFNIPAITQTAHKVGALAGFDLAHAAGNLPLHLHDWNVDFAAWCSYKYLNSGPGNVSGIFIHEKHGLNPETPRLAGWWGHKEDIRFLMQKGYIPEPGAAGWQMSNAPVFGMAVHLASLEIFHKAGGVVKLREKSIQLTEFLFQAIKRANKTNPKLNLSVITPENPEERGCQLSILTGENGKSIFDFLASRDIIADWREPNVIRMAPTPLYNSFEELYRLYETLCQFE